MSTAAKGADRVTIWDKDFSIFIQEKDIQERVSSIATRINEDYAGKSPIFLAVLNGAFMFAADLFRNITIDCEITFVKLASYAGTETTGKVKSLIGLKESLQDRHIVVIEDIVDTGITMDKTIKQLEIHDPASIQVACMLTKPDAHQKKVEVEYLGFKVPNKFLVGYGLDYNGRGRNLPHIYQLA